MKIGDLKTGQYTMRYTAFFILLLTLGCLALSSHEVQSAEGGSVLFVAPHRLIVLPTEKVSVLNIANKSSEARRYDLTLIDQQMDANGVTQRVETFPYSAKSMVKFVPRRFSLQPGEQQTVRVMIERPAGLPDGDYHSHLLFREVPLNMKDKAQLEAERKAAEGQKAVSFDIRTLYGIAVPVIVQQGKLIADMNITQPKIAAAADGKGREIAMDFIRIGNSEAAGLLKADYVQPGKAPVPVIQPQWVRLYREVDKVSKSIPLIDLPKDAKGGKIVVSLIKDEADDSKTIKKEVAFN
jgi:hypothetical protein